MSINQPINQSSDKAFRFRGFTDPDGVQTLRPTLLFSEFRHFIPPCLGV